MRPLVLGLTGSFGSGCTTIAQILREREEFQVQSLSTPIRQTAEKEGRPQERDVLQEIGDRLRREKGRDFLAQEAVKVANAENTEAPLVLSGIRNLGEVDWLRSSVPNFYLMAIDASFDIRWGRLKERYKKDQGKFEDDDNRDRDEPEATGQQVAGCVDAADVFILNEDDFSDSLAVKDRLVAHVMDYVGLMRSPGRRRPTYPELLMNQAYSASLRSSCVKRQVGAVVATPDNAVLAAGYNEVPHCETNCQEQYGECYRDRVRREYNELVATLQCECGKPIGRKQRCECNKDFRPLYDRGKALDYCRALHAEERAILQVTRFGGMGLGGTTIYTTTFPCLMCAKKIVHAGITSVVYVEAYPIREAATLLQNAGVRVTRFEGIKAQAFHRLFRRPVSQPE